MNEPKERGEASILIELKEGIIRVYHGTDRVVLTKWEAERGDWDRIWETIDKLKERAK